MEMELALPVVIVLTIQFGHRASELVSGVICRIVFLPESAT